MTTSSPADPSSSSPHPAPDQQPLHPHAVHDLIGGWPAFETLVDDFYDRVEQDHQLRSAYPEDLEPGKYRLALFFAQYWGGGNVYSSRYGHPRLRMRHAPFEVTPDRAARWAHHMAEAIRAQGFPDEAEALMLTYVAQATPTMINQHPDLPEGLPLRRA